MNRPCKFNKLELVTVVTPLIVYVKTDLVLKNWSFEPEVVFLLHFEIYDVIENAAVEVDAALFSMNYIWPDIVTEKSGSSRMVTSDASFKLFVPSQVRRFLAMFFLPVNASDQFISIRKSIWKVGASVVQGKHLFNLDNLRLSQHLELLQYLLYIIKIHRNNII